MYTTPSCLGVFTCAAPKFPKLIIEYRYARKKKSGRGKKAQIERSQMRIPAETRDSGPAATNCHIGLGYSLLSSRSPVSPSFSRNKVNRLQLASPGTTLAAHGTCSPARNKKGETTYWILSEKHVTNACICILRLANTAQQTTTTTTTTTTNSFHHNKRMGEGDE